MKIEQEDLGERGIFRAIENGRVIGEITYFWRDDDTFCIDHTGVDSMYEGKGLGKKLVNAAVDYARKNEKKIVPYCSFAVSMFRRYPEYKEVEGHLTSSLRHPNHLTSLSRLNNDCIARCFSVRNNVFV